MRTVLFLCTGNSCRSIMAEALLNHFGSGTFKVYSAGSFPTGYVHPMSLETLCKRGIATEGYRSKSWDEFTGEAIDIVITVCDNAAGESCPLFPGNWVKAHWGVPDPAKFIGTELKIAAEFSRICDMLERRVRKLAALPVESMGKQELTDALTAIAREG